jgi:simple sugar transport system ATP-binding protein
MTALIEAIDIEKRFGPTTALRGVSFAVEAGEIHALLGDNGAGKSTLIQVLLGVHQPDGGELRWEGNVVRLASARSAMDLGIAVVFQDLAIIDSMPIYRNFFLGRERAMTRRVGPLRIVSPRFARAQAAQALREAGISSVRSMDDPVGTLSGGERQAIAIARATHFDTKLLVLDEPTSALSLKESEKVFDSVRNAREKGVGVIIITHNLADVGHVADRFTVLEHGKSLGTFRRDETDIAELARLIRAA